MTAENWKQIKKLAQAQKHNAPFLVCLLASLIVFDLAQAWGLSKWHAGVLGFVGLVAGEFAQMLALRVYRQRDPGRRRSDGVGDR